MSDVFTETSTTGWFGRIGNSIKGIVVGGLLFVASFVVLFWNEGRAVHRAKDLGEAKSACVSADPSRIDPANENKLLHITGASRVSEPVADKLFAVQDNVIALRRKVSMYQWTEKKKSEKKKNLGGSETTTTTYSYTKQWDDDLIDSSEFSRPEGHANPTSKPFDSMTQHAKSVTVGALSLASNLIAEIDNFEPMTISADAPLPAGVKGDLKPHNGGYYVGNRPAEPQIGDCRINFEVVRPGPVTIVARQVGSGLANFATTYNPKFSIVHIGTETIEQTFKAENDKNTMLTWLIRGGGFLVMWIGLCIVLSPLKVLADVVPFIGSIVGGGIAIISLLIAAVLSLVTIGVAWIFYRPLLGIGLIALAAVAIVMIKKRLSKGKNAMTSAAPLPPLPPIPQS